MSDAMETQEEAPMELSMNQLIDYLTGRDEISMECMKADPKKEIARRLRVAEQHVGVFDKIMTAFRGSEFSQTNGELVESQALLLNMLIQYLASVRQYIALHEQYHIVYHEHEKLKVQLAEDKVLSAAAIAKERALSGTLEEERDLLRAKLRQSWRHRLAAWLIGVKS